MKYKPLTPLQQEKYNSQKKAYEHPVVESEEAEEQQEEEAKAIEEAPENAVAESSEKDTDKGEDKGAETSILREEPKEVSTEDIAAKALAAVAETEEVPLTAEKKEACTPCRSSDRPYLCGDEELYRPVIWRGCRSGDRGASEESRDPQNRASG